MADLVDGDEAVDDDGDANEGDGQGNEKMRQVSPRLEKSTHFKFNSLEIRF